MVYSVSNTSRKSWYSSGTVSLSSWYHSIWGGNSFCAVWPRVTLEIWLGKCCLHWGPHWRMSLLSQSNCTLWSLHQGSPRMSLYFLIGATSKVMVSSCPCFVTIWVCACWVTLWKVFPVTIWRRRGWACVVVGILWVEIIQGWMKFPIVPELMKVERGRDSSCIQMGMLNDSGFLDERVETIVHSSELYFTLSMEATGAEVSSHSLKNLPQLPPLWS